MRIPFSVAREAYARIGVKPWPSTRKLERRGLIGATDLGPRIGESMREVFAENVADVLRERQAADPWPDFAIGADGEPMKIGQRVSDKEDGAIGVLRMIHGRDNDPIVTVRMPDGFGRSKAASGFIGT